MKVKDTSPFWGTKRDPLMSPLNPTPKIIFATRPPNILDIPFAPWWYDRVAKIMYRATDEGYIKD